MDNYENDFDDPIYGQDFEDDYDAELPKPQPRRRMRLNPVRRIIKNRKSRPVTRNLPAKKNLKEMSVRKAKKLLFGSRHPGRPSRELSEKLKQAKQVLQAAGEPLRRKNPKQIVRPRGRPKKVPVVAKQREKRPRGRPRKPLPATPVVKRPRGRPKKEVSTPAKIKRPRGRPRKNPIQQLAESIKKRGRPKKNTNPDQSS